MNYFNKQTYSTNYNGMLEGVINRHLSETITIYSNKRTDYSELHLFKHQIEMDTSGPLFQPYSVAKSSAKFYRIIFLSLGLLYLLLGAVIYFKSLTWTCGLIFGKPSLVKTVICGFCGFAAFSSIFLGFLIKTEREAVKRAFRQAKKQIGKIYERKVIKLGIKRFFYFGQGYQTYLALKQIHHDALEKLHEYKEDALHLVDRIANSDSADVNMKEMLYNQAISELKDKMELVIKTFRTTKSPQLIEKLS